MRFFLGFEHRNFDENYLLTQCVLALYDALRANVFVKTNKSLSLQPEDLFILYFRINVLRFRDNYQIFKHNHLLQNFMRFLRIEYCDFDK